jgi:hypothetical protein
MIENLPAATDAADAMSAMSGLSVHIAGDGSSGVTSILGVMIPIIAIVFGIGIGMLSLYLDYRKKREFFELHHKERMAAIEKGVEVPALPPEFFLDPRRKTRTPSDYLRRGLIWLLVGVAITAALYQDNDHDGKWGLVPAAVGLAYLLFYFLDGKRDKNNSNDSATKM